MKQLNLQMFGGRGSASGAAKSAGGAAKGAATKSPGGGGGTRERMPTVKKRTPAEINAMTRKQAVNAARSIFVRNNMRQGLTRTEAERRFNALVDGNTTPQLKKYIRRNQ